MAVDTGVPGGTGGIVTIGANFAIAVDEAADGRDHDGTPGVDRVVIGAHVPASSGQSWNFMHGGGSVPVEVTWMDGNNRGANRFSAAISGGDPCHRSQW